MKAMRTIGCVGVVAGIAFAAAPAHSQDFFANLFGGYQRQVERPVIRMPFAPEFRGEGYIPRRSREHREADDYVGIGGRQAYCVRTCDGRYFPISTSGDASKAASCNHFCPAAETRVYYGSAIDNAASDNGRRYSDLPNAFRFRKEMVAGCTCNGSTTGLAPISISDDSTLRRGDIVAGAVSLMVSHRSDRKGAELKLAPAPSEIRAKYERLPVFASD